MAKCRTHKYDNLFDREPEHYNDCPRCKRLWDDRLRKLEAKHSGKKKRRRAKKGSRTARRRYADYLFSRIIRARGACERCNSTEKLQTSHIISRRYLVTRWLEENANCLCAKHHFRWHEFPEEARFWFDSVWPGRWNHLYALAVSEEVPDLEATILQLEARCREIFGGIPKGK